MRPYVQPGQVTPRLTTEEPVPNCATKQNRSGPLLVAAQNSGDYLVHQTVLGGDRVACLETGHVQQLGSCQVALEHIKIRQASARDAPLLLLAGCLGKGERTDRNPDLAGS
jgi:hypothetical protein